MEGIQLTLDDFFKNYYKQNVVNGINDNNERRYYRISESLGLRVSNIDENIKKVEIFLDGNYETSVLLSRSKEFTILCDGKKTYLETDNGFRKLIGYDLIVPNKRTADKRITNFGPDRFIYRFK